MLGMPRGNAEILALRDRLRLLLEQGEAGPIVCDVAALDAPDCATVDSLARLQLTARRLGREIRLRHVSPELHELLALAGLCEAVGCAD